MNAKITVYCDDGCGRYFVADSADFDKIDGLPWTCPVCEQEQRDAHVTVEEWWEQLHGRSYPSAIRTRRGAF